VEGKASGRLGIVEKELGLCGKLIRHMLPAMRQRL
jgi:hypothetical protein